jgi:hypothetical protein
MLGVAVLERMLGLFVLAQCLHIAWWRWRRPSGYLFWFLKAWLIGPALCITFWLVGLALSSGAVDWGDVLVYGALCGAYVMIYPAISELSPSLELLRMLQRAPGATLAIASIEIATVVGLQSVIQRVANLQSSGFAIREDGVMQVTPKGYRIASLVDAYRRLLGIKQRAGG